MSRFNTYFANDFRACRLLAYARDIYREREVRIYQIPGEWECVGVTDGTDKWIAPVSANPFSVNVGRLLQDLREGKPLPKPTPPQPPGSRRRATLAVEPSQSPTKPRRALLDAPAQPQTAPRSRRVLQA